MEDGLFPSYMSITAENPSVEIEEERRLCYVGITRAMNELTISYALSRMVRGEMQYSAISRFVKEIPALLLDNSLPRRKVDYSAEPEQTERADSFRKAVSSKPFIASADAVSRGKDIVKADGLDYSVGDRVKHIKFGPGTVLDIKDGGRDFEVTVEFERAGVKKMFAAFAKLQKM